MIKTSTLQFNEKNLKVKTTPLQCELPEFVSVKPHILQNILNYSKSLEIKKSELLGEIEIVKS